MKNFLFIVGLFLSVFLFIPVEEVSKEEMLANAREAVMQEKQSTDMEHQLAVLSSELKESNCLTPRRTIQTTSCTYNLRLQQGAVRMLQDLMAKGHDRLCQVSENVSINQSINYHTLLSRLGYHIYTLRKLRI